MGGLGLLLDIDWVGKVTSKVPQNAGKTVMKISKDNLCDACRKIRPGTNAGDASGLTVEELLDSQDYNEQGGYVYIMVNQGILSNLTKGGGCPSCISLLKRANQF